MCAEPKKTIGSNHIDIEGHLSNNLDGVNEHAPRSSCPFFFFSSLYLVLFILTLVVQRGMKFRGKASFLT